jgi:GTP-binding protein
MRSVDEAEVVACLLDAMEAGAEQDARLLGLVAEKAKALVCVVNKWDLATKEGATQAWYREQLKKKLPFVAWAPLLFISAKSGQGVGKVLATAARLVEQYRARFPTPALNELLEELQASHPAPIVRGHRVKLYYVAQVASSPPTFVIQCNHPESVSEHYQRYVENRFREAFGLEVPARIIYTERRRRSRPPPSAAEPAKRSRGPRGGKPGRGGRGA